MNISVIIPLYNQAEYLEDCIESVYGQSYQPLEIIIVNDGSTDNSAEIAERYRFAEFPGIESPVRVIHQVNKGLPAARNTGIMNASGDYCFFLDADDILEENALEKIVSAWRQTNADIIAPSFKTFGKQEQTIILGVPTIEEMKIANRFGYFCAIRRSAILECGGYSPRMKYGYEDYHLWFDLFSRGKTVGVIQEPLVRYRMKDKSMLMDAQEHHEDLMNQIKKDFPSIWQR